MGFDNKLECYLIIAHSAPFKTEFEAKIYEFEGTVEDLLEVIKEYKNLQGDIYIIGVEYKDYLSKLFSTFVDVGEIDVNSKSIKLPSLEALEKIVETLLNLDKYFEYGSIRGVEFIRINWDWNIDKLIIFDSERNLHPLKKMIEQDKKLEELYLALCEPRPGYEYLRSGEVWKYLKRQDKN